MLNSFVLFSCVNASRCTLMPQDNQLMVIMVLNVLFVKIASLQKNHNLSPTHINLIVVYGRFQ